MRRDIVQLVERWSPKPNVEGSSPSVPAGKSHNRKIVTFFVRESYDKIFPIEMKNVMLKTSIVRNFGMKKEPIIVRGGGDIATGTIYKLIKCGYPVLVLETERPSAIRRNVAFSEAVYEGSWKVEDVTARLAKDLEEAGKIMAAGEVAVMIDSSCEVLEHMKPAVLVDGILAKKNLGTNPSMAPVTIALGPGFEAGKDVDAVIETMRGHQLGRIILEGSAIPNTGVPGSVAGVTKERVIYSPAAGILRNVRQITDTVEQGELIAYVETQSGKVEILATISGLLRGMIRDGYEVTDGFKIADIDPRVSEYGNCFTISDKARCIAGGVLEAILYLQNKKEQEVR